MLDRSILPGKVERIIEPWYIWLARELTNVLTH
ncbi:MAG: hypothetical protein ACI9VO_000272 [Colwellia sp.]|jgi:hypothetical protein